MLAAVLAALAASVALACSGSSGRRAPRPAVRSSQATGKPAGVPAAAQAVTSDLTVGSADERGAADHLFFSLGCAQDVLNIITTRETFYASLPCDRSPPHSALERFLGTPLQVRVVTSHPAKLFVLSKAGGSSEFTVGGVWILRR